MYFTSLPDHSSPGFNEELHFSKFRNYNIIFNAETNYSLCEHHVGCLSLKTVWSGEEWYGIDKRNVAVRPGQFLILNDDQEYSSKVMMEKTKSLSIFFRKDLVLDVFRDLSCTEETLLDLPYDSFQKMPEFFQTLYNLDPYLKQKLKYLICGLNEWGYHKDRVDEQFIFLLQDIIIAHKKEISRSKHIKAIKQSSKKEIFKRVSMAKDFLHSNFMKNSELSLLSKETCLSVPQLVRQFKAVYHTTPHQYQMRMRLAYAAELLKHSKSSVQEITWNCGFENTSAFCRSFKKVYGVQPITFRKMI